MTDSLDEGRVSFGDRDEIELATATDPVCGRELKRADACSDPALKAVLLHNRNEEVEHGTMTLEWLRRNDATFDKFLRRYLFKEADIIAIEKAADEEEPGEGESTAGGAEPVRNDGSLGIRSLRGPV